VKREGIGLEVASQLFRMQGIQIRYGAGDGPWHVEIRIPQAGPHHILVIDDMPDIPRLFQRFTTAQAVEVIGAENADQAFEILQHLTPTIILLDVMLPRRDGWEILQTLKANPATASIPVIVCSILNEPELATALGADGYLRKPVSQEALLQALSDWLHLDLEPAATQP
jgi:CheY-like chemotaxis protein